ncbi:MAG: hypothetical protein ACO3FE_17730, partial [Planctomycetaceae bacterium]
MTKESRDEFRKPLPVPVGRHNPAAIPQVVCGRAPALNRKGLMQRSQFIRKYPAWQKPTRTRQAGVSNFPG